MTTLVHVTPLDPSYPSRLHSLRTPPASLTVQGGPLEAEHTVAIVGSRKAWEEAYGYTRQLAKALASAGAVVISGGALGIDEAAHEGALEAGGRTWCVAGTGHLRCFPPEHRDLFDRIASGPGAMLWPFAPLYSHRAGFLLRNGFLVALADAIVVVQAGFPSGALRAAACARKLGRPVWVLPVPPWEPWSGPAFDGSRRLLEAGGRPLLSTERLLVSLHLSASPPHEDTVTRVEDDEPALRALNEAELRVLSVTSADPIHKDSIVDRAHLPAQAVSSALLTLALENVVVEDPPGFFRRALARKH